VKSMVVTKEVLPSLPLEISAAYTAERCCVIMRVDYFVEIGVGDPCC
jgi:hypothetical protein